MKRIVLAVFVAMFAAAMVTTNALAAKEKGERKAGATSVMGTLNLVKDAEGKVTGTTITTKSGTVYKLAGLAQNVADLDGKEVSVKGELKDDAGTMTLTVKGHIVAAGEKKAKPENKMEHKGKKNPAPAK
jgi:hypothetical protein